MIDIYSLVRHDIFASNCYVVSGGDEAAVIDPSVSYEMCIEKYPHLRNMQFKYVLLTHAHMDHFCEIDSFVAMGATVVVSIGDAPALADNYLNCARMLGSDITGYFGDYITVADNDIIGISGAEFKVMYTPGHTRGSVCYLMENNLFSGDTLFSGGGYGRYDLPGGNARDLSDSLRKLFLLDGTIKLFSGHSPESTIEETKRYF